MIPTVAHAVAILLAAALQRAWPAPLSVGGVGPDLVLILVACIGITRGPVAGCAAGLLGGFLAAAAGGTGAYGALLASHMAVGFLTGQARGRLFVDHVVAALVVVLLATILGALVHFVVSPPSHFVPWLGGLALGAIYNTLVSPVGYLYARAVNLRWPISAEA